jgi:hypothetical protein
MPERQFIAVQFKVGPGRAYTYHNDGEPVAIGDIVRVTTRTGAEQSATVVGLEDDAPPFETKPIVGKYETEETIDGQ